MKTQIFNLNALFALFLQSGWAEAAIPTYVKDLAFECTGKAVVQSVANAKYDKGLPPHGRFPGTPDKSGFDVVFKVTELASGCAPLSSKYGLNVNGYSFGGSINTNPVFKQKAIEQLAQGTVGQSFDIVLQQYIGYQANGGYLPLFPLVHSENLSFKIVTGLQRIEFNGGFELKPDINWVYSLTPVSQMSDIEKLSIASKTAKLLALNQFGDFLGLYLQLEPHDMSLKKAYGDLIWSVFHQLKVSGSFIPQVLYFDVGGDGSFHGKPLAEKLGSITQIPGLYSAQEIQDLIFDVPTIVLTGLPSEGTCVSFSGADLEAVLNQVEDQLPILTASEKHLLKSPLQGIAQGSIWGYCLEGKVSPKAKAKAKELFLNLN